MSLIKKLHEISREENIPIDEVMNKFNFTSKKIYEREYGKFLEESYIKSCNIIDRYYKIKNSK